MIKRKKEMIAMLLAGGQGSRLKSLTKRLAKPAVPFGGKYRIIDFALSNCSNSDIYTVGVLTQYHPLLLNNHIGIGSPWDLDRRDGGVSILPPFVREEGGRWYKGTANAIYENIEFIENYNPEYLLVLSGDHIYKMDYQELLEYHKEKGADVTISVIEVPWEETNRFGIMNTNDDFSIYEFDEKPKNAKNNLASMGIYIFDWKKLKSYLIEDEKDKSSSNDFGKNIIPKMLNDNLKLYAYSFKGYWKDVGTINSLWEANMDLIRDNPLDLYSKEWKIYSKNPISPPHYISKEGKVKNSLLNEGCIIHGDVKNSVLSPGVYIGENSKVIDSVIMPNVKIKDHSIIKRAIITSDVSIDSGSIIGKENSEITVISE
ncbi:MAG: glucose-1-phosphate adenylyltransferase [Firmicutes bacterium]|nr:glucose-1-phosphate adenylyltransferase [Bacillota bacterium]